FVTLLLAFASTQVATADYFLAVQEASECTTANSAAKTARSIRDAFLRGDQPRIKKLMRSNGCKDLPNDLAAESGLEYQPHRLHLSFPIGDRRAIVRVVSLRRDGILRHFVFVAMQAKDNGVDEDQL
ncbi:MAG: hypothetical protein WA021_01775, partial [Minisyncoccia bacterium]